MTTDTKHLRALAEGATPGPWEDGMGTHGNPADGPEFVEVRAGKFRIAELELFEDAAHDAAYIAAIDPPTLTSLLDELEGHRRWKAEAMQVHAKWEETWIAAGRPGRWGASKAESVRDEIERLRDEGGWSVDRTRNSFTGEWFERLVTPWEPVEGDTLARHARDSGD